MTYQDKKPPNLPAVPGLRGIYYGWVVAVAGAVVILAAVNFQYTFGVFVIPLVDTFGWSRAAVSGTVSARSIVSSFGNPVIGTMSDRYGSRRFILLGVLLVGLSYILTSRVSSLWHIYLTMGLLTGVGLSAVFVPATATATRWFGEKSAIANGIVSSGFGLAQIIIPPLAMMIILRYGWGTCFLLLGGAAWVLGSAALYFIRVAPLRLRPAAVSGQGITPVDRATAVPDAEFTLSEALHTGTFWLMMTVFMITASSYHMVIIHIIPAAIDAGIKPEAAALILTASGVTNTMGRLASGFLANRVGGKSALIACLFVQAVSLFFLSQTSELLSYYIIAAVYGMVYGGVSPLVPTIGASYFGTRAIGAIFGVLMVAYTSGVTVGPLLGGIVYDLTQSYYYAFLGAGVFIVLGMLLAFLLKHPVKKIAAS